MLYLYYLIEFPERCSPYFAQFTDKEFGTWRVAHSIQLLSGQTVIWLLSLTIVLLMMGQEDVRARERRTNKPRSSLWHKVTVNSRDLSVNHLLIGLFISIAI